MPDSSNSESVGEVEVFLHEAGRKEPEQLSVRLEDGVRSLLNDPESENVWLQDRAGPLDPDCQLSEVGVTNGCNLHRSVCPTIKAAVRFEGKTEYNEFDPATVIDKVFDWAVGDKGFKLDPKAAGGYGLKLPDADEFLAGSRHIGTVADIKQCAAALDLAKHDHFAG